MNGNRPKQDPPRSMSNLYSSVPNDIGALSERQQAALNLVKKSSRGLHYDKFARSVLLLCLLLLTCFSDLFETQPNDVRKYAAVTYGTFIVLKYQITLSVNVGPTQYDHDKYMVLVLYTETPYKSGNLDAAFQDEGIVEYRRRDVSISQGNVKPCFLMLRSQPSRYLRYLFPSHVSSIIQ
ncbi:unnamed protein product [Hymenolepis diminuta]|uniref:Transmembrane protein n=1 Tax=Hymenolepis diminuta TaxID=6216 RepID=A0A0R3ST96_HYMDI|nr:unnamed protein product [Hymenolepis diminuta]